MALVVETNDRIGITRLSRWIFNCYLIHDGGDGRAIVVDAGLPSVVDDLLALLPRVGLSAGAVAAVVATHGHSDHVGGAAQLARRLGCGVHLLGAAIPATRTPPRAAAHRG